MFVEVTLARPLSLEGEGKNCKDKRKSMKPVRALLALLLFVPAVWAGSVQPADEAVVALPQPRMDGKVSVEKALKGRRSLRKPAQKPLSLAEVGQLCWAAQGVTDGKGHRTAPSALASYPLELYVIAGDVKDLVPGFYRYLPVGHRLERVSPGDQRSEFVKKAVGQGWIAQAPCIFILSGSIERMSKMKDRRMQFMATEAGLSAQGFFLQAEAMGLGSTFVGGFNPMRARKALGLPASEEVLAVLPVGKKP